MEIIHSWQTLADNMAVGEYGYLEIRGHEGRDPEKQVYIRAYKSKDSQIHSAVYHLPEKHRKSVKEVAALHGIEYDELPDREATTKVQKEFEEWTKRIKDKNLDTVSHYEKALELAQELSYGVVHGYWGNEIAKPVDIFDLRRNAGWPRGEFNAGRNRLYNYMMDRIGYGSRVGQSYTTKRGAFYYHGGDEKGDIDLMIGTLLGIGMLRKTDVNNVYELSCEAFALLKKTKWHERHAELLSWISIIAVILSIVLMLNELRIIWQG